MEERQTNYRLLKIFFKHAPAIVFLSIVIAIVWLIQKPPTAYQNKHNISGNASFFNIKECSQDEKRIAKHFSADTLPGLMQKGLIHGYRRNISGTSIAVNGRLWNRRSKFFKTCLLTEISVFNKVHGYEISARITDSVSGKLYAYLSPEAEMNFFD